MPLCAGRATPRAPNHVDQGPIVEKAVAASVEWIMVRMDNYFCHVLMRQTLFLLLLCGVGAEPCKPYEKHIRSME